MRKYAAILFAVWMALSAAAFAASAEKPADKTKTVDPETGSSMVNGFGWEKFSKGDKKLFMSGIGDVMSSVSVVSVLFDDAEMDDETVSFIESLSNLVPQGITVDESVKSVDNFYAAKGREVIPVVAAYFATIVLDQGWADDEQVGATIEKLRKYYAGEYVPGRAGENTEASVEQKAEVARAADEDAALREDRVENR